MSERHIDIKPEDIIRSPEQYFQRKHSKGKVTITEKKHKYGHMDVANQAVKMIFSAIPDRFVRMVMFRRIMGPAQTGHERTHVSIAIELGAPVKDVVQAEAYGVQVLEDLMKKIEQPDFIAKFNSERAVVAAVQNELGKSA